MLMTLFRPIVALSLSMIPVLLLVYLLTPLLTRRYHPGLRAWLWLGISLRMLIPVSGGGRGIRIPAGDAVYLLEQDTGAVLRAFAQWQGTDTAAPQMEISSRSLLSVFALLWICGALLFLLWQIAAYLVQSLRLRRWNRPEEDQIFLQQYRAIKLDAGIAADLPVYRNTQISTPMLAGIFRPAILLPDHLAPEALELVLRHELAHYRRRDLWKKLLLMAVRAVYWFHPLVHLMAVSADNDLELACDAETLRGAGTQERRAYGFAILSCLQEHSGQVPLVSRFALGRGQLKSRFQALADTRAKKNGKTVLPLLLAVILASGSLVGFDTVVAMGKKTLEKANPVPQESDVEAEEVFDGGFDHDSNAYEDFVQLYETLEWEDVSSYEGGTMLWPAPDYYTISSAYGWRFDGADFHTGIDISGADIDGAPVAAAAAGTVVYAKENYTGYGHHLIIDHGSGVSTLYAQMSGITVSPGDVVAAGQQVGMVGRTGWATGPHLHFEVRENGVHTDPKPWLTE